MYGGVFVVGYLLSMVVSAWERQSFVEAEVASNGVASLLRVGLSDELDLLQRDLAATVPPLEAAQAKSSQADSAFGDVRTQLVTASRRAAMIKERYANTPADERELRYQLARARLSLEREAPKTSDSVEKKADKDRDHDRSRRPRRFRRPRRPPAPATAGEVKKASSPG